MFCLLFVYSHIWFNSIKQSKANQGCVSMYISKEYMIGIIIKPYMPWYKKEGTPSSSKIAGQYKWHVRQQFRVCKMQVADMNPADNSSVESGEVFETLINPVPHRSIRAHEGQTEGFQHGTLGIRDLPVAHEEHYESRSTGLLNSLLYLSYWKNHFTVGMF